MAIFVGGFLPQKQKHFQCTKKKLGQYFLLFIFFGGGVINSVWIHIDRRLPWKIMLSHAYFSWLTACFLTLYIHSSVYSILFSAICITLLQKYSWYSLQKRFCPLIFYIVSLDSFPLHPPSKPPQEQWEVLLFFLGLVYPQALGRYSFRIISSPPQASPKSMDPKGHGCATQEDTTLDGLRCSELDWKQIAAWWWWWLLLLSSTFKGVPNGS